MERVAAAAGERLTPVFTAVLVGGLTGAAMAGGALLAARLWRGRTNRQAKTGSATSPSTLIQSRPDNLDR